jgi:hypothetical protein
MPRSAPGRPAAETGLERLHPALRSAIVRSTEILRDTRSLLVAWGMAARLVLLVVDYLCHVIVHFSCMNEMGAAPATGRCARRQHPMSRYKRDNTICRNADGG